MINQKWRFPLFVALFVFGFLISTQYSTQQAVVNSLSSQNQEDLVALIKSLNEKRNQMEKEVDELVKTRNSLAEETTSRSNLYTNLSNELERLQIINGTIPIHGPGIKIIITGDSELYYKDLIDLVNELWVSGAEAVSINHSQVLSNTIISQDTNDNKLIIKVNNKALLNPIIIEAIGNPETLEAGLTFPGGIIDSFNMLYQVFPVIKQEEDVVIPAVG